MNETIATKSIKEIVAHGIIIIILLMIMLMVYQYDLNVDSPIELELRFFMIVLFLLVFFLLANLIHMIALPKSIIECDGKQLIIHRRKRKITIPLESIEVISKRINIWAKPFLVYADIRIETHDKTHIIKHIQDIPGVVDRIRRLMDIENAERIRF